MLLCVLSIPLRSPVNTTTASKLIYLTELPKEDTDTKHMNSTRKSTQTPDTWPIKKEAGRRPALKYKASPRHTRELQIDIHISMMIRESPTGTQTYIISLILEKQRQPKAGFKYAGRDPYRQESFYARTWPSEGHDPPTGTFT